MSVWRKRKLKTYEDLPELRRQAFVDCIMNKSLEDSIVGIFGNVNEPLIYAYGLYTVPMEGLDSHIFSFGEYDGCDLVKSTIIYLKTEKCPLLFSAKMYVVEDFCDHFIESLQGETEKPICVYRNEDELKLILEEVYKREYSKELHEIAIEEFKKMDLALNKLHISNLSGREIFEVEFFSRYLIDIKERRKFLEETVEKLDLYDCDRITVTAVCPGGIYRAIDSDLNTIRYGIKRDIDNPIFTCKGCFMGKIKFNY